MIRLVKFGEKCFLLDVAGHDSTPRNVLLDARRNLGNNGYGSRDRTNKRSLQTQSTRETATLIRTSLKVHSCLSARDPSCRRQNLFATSSWAARCLCLPSCVAVDIIKPHGGLIVPGAQHYSGVSNTSAWDRHLTYNVNSRRWWVDLAIYISVCVEFRVVYMVRRCWYFRFFFRLVCLYTSWSSVHLRFGPHTNSWWYFSPTEIPKVVPIGTTISISVGEHICCYWNASFNSGINLGDGWAFGNA